MRALLLLCGFMLLGAAAAQAGDAVPATAYFPVLPFDAPPDLAPQFVPLAANHALDGAHPGVTRAIIVIHDESRDANNALALMSALAGTANTATMIIAPQFLLSSDIARFADHLPDKGRAFASWQLYGWAAGDESVLTPARQSLSSFTVVDLLLMVLSDRAAFPDLQAITVAGSGAGAGFVQRYAAFGIAADVLARQNITLRFVVAAAPSYLYLTATRPLHDMTGRGRKGFGRPDPAACPDYNAYPYGLDKLNPYARHVGANEAKTDYATRFVTYLNAPAPDIAPDGNCGAQAQGIDGTARATAYAAYMQSLFGDVAARTQTFAVIKDGKNDAVSLYGSACGMAALFGDGTCASGFTEQP